MEGLIVPYFAIGSGDEITIDGVTYKVPRIDSGGRVYVNAKAVDASEVKAVLEVTTDPSTTRETVVTPTSGKRIRVVSVQLLNGGTTGTTMEVYFGTGVGIGTDETKAIADFWLDVDVQPCSNMVWPDGGGPVGAVNEVVSLKTGANIASAGILLLHYREE